MAPSSVALSFEAIDDLIYSARAGDITALREDITRLSQEYQCSPATVIESAIDNEDESEGGTGACLLHWPAANGNIEILRYLLESIGSNPSPAIETTNAITPALSPLINHRNHSGNTPLHWAALNAHIECVKAFVSAGADVKEKNDAGHDAAFLAERTEWSSQEEENTPGNQNEEGNEGESSAPQTLSPAMQVVELLLTSGKDNETEQNGAEANGRDGGEKADGVAEPGTS